MMEDKMWPLIAVIVGCVAIVAIFGMVGITGAASMGHVELASGAQNQYGEDRFPVQVLYECKQQCQIGGPEDDIILAIDELVPSGYVLDQKKSDCLNWCVLKDPTMAQFWEKRVVASKQQTFGELEGRCITSAFCCENPDSEMCVISICQEILCSSNCLGGCGTPEECRAVGGFWCTK